MASGSQQLSIDTGLSNARSLPATPATTPPANNMQGMQSYPTQTGYDSSKPYYSTAPQSQAQYASQQSLAQPNMASYGQTMAPNSYVKNEMGPPSARPSGVQGEAEPVEVKSERYAQTNGQVSQGTAEGEPAVQEQESEYLNNNSAAYNTNRNSYTYTTNPSVGSLVGDHSQMTPAMTGSPSQQNGTDQMTPRTAGGASQQWAQGYNNTPPKSAQSSSLYNIVSDTRSTATNGNAADSYPAANAASGYSASVNGLMGSTKRVREDEDDRGARPDSRGGEYDHKRRKTLTEAPVGGPVGGPLISLQPVKAGVMTRRR